VKAVLLEGGGAYDPTEALFGAGFIHTSPAPDPCQHGHDTSTTPDTSMISSLIRVFEDWLF
jgi:hypothetical protein